MEMNSLLNLENDKGFGLLAANQDLTLIKEYKERLVESNKAAISSLLSEDSKDDDDIINEKVNEAIKQYSLAQLNDMSDDQIDDIYTSVGLPTEINVDFKDPKKTKSFKKDFLIHIRQTKLMLDNVDKSMNELETTLSADFEEVNKLLATVGDVETYIQNKLHAELEDEKTSEERKIKLKNVLSYIDDALTLNRIYNYYSGNERYKGSVKKGFEQDFIAEKRYSKYKKLCALLGVRTDLTTYNDLEKTFLPDKYQKYNNFFLYTIIHYYSYNAEKALPEFDGIFLSQLSTNLKKLFTGKLDETKKELLLESIKKMLDMFFQ